MRYEDWDVLLFPAGEDSKVPIKEFKVACHVVQDAEFAHINQSFGVPTVCCFVPSLSAGTPFQVSMHSWKPPPISHFTQSYTTFIDSVMFQARLFIDGRLVASTAFNRSSGWPHVLANSFEFSKNGDLELLKFPCFRQELLHQDHWNPADDLGRIKLLISEAFPRDSYTTPVERVKNIVAFAFQHAPLDILETSGIAWPNQSMWQRQPYTTSKPVPSLTAEGSNLHAHSLRRRTRQAGTSRYVMPVFQSTNAAEPSAFSSGSIHSLSKGATGESAPDDADVYFDWLGQINPGLGSTLANNSIRDVDTRNARRSSTDTSMPDYVSLGGHAFNKSDNVFASLPIHEDDGASMDPMGTIQAPTNTPTNQSASFGSDKETKLSLFRNSGSIPPDLAETLTTSLLNQSAPVKMPSQSASHPPAAEIKSRKENQAQARDVIPSSDVSGSFFRPGFLADQKASQERRVVTAATLPFDAVVSATNSPENFDSKKGLNPATRISSTSNYGVSLTSDTTPDHALRAVSGNSEKSNKRARIFTPASSKAIDGEGEPGRGSPRVRLTPFTEADGSLLE